MPNDIIHHDGPDDIFPDKGPSDETLDNAITTCFDDDEMRCDYLELRDEVEYNCSFCEGVLMDVADLDEKAREAFAATARRLKGVYDIQEIVNRRFALCVLLEEIYSAAMMLSMEHQICGADLASIEACRREAKELYKLHCPPKAKCV